MVYYRHMTTYSFSRLVPAALGLFLFAPLFVSAQLPCGDIIGPVDNTDYETIVTVPVADCNDPFDTANNFTPGPSPYTLTINGEEVSDMDTITIEGDEVTDYEVQGTPSLDEYYTFFYLHDGDDYQFIDTRVPDFAPTEEELREYAEDFDGFDDVADIDPFIEAILAEECWTLDEWELCYEFYDFAETLYYDDPPRPALEPGTYTMVVTEYTLDETFNTLWGRVFAFFVPTAHAQSATLNRYTLTFTLEEGEEDDDEGEDEEEEDEDEDIDPPSPRSGTTYGSRPRSNIEIPTRYGSLNRDELLELLQQILVLLMQFISEQSQQNGGLTSEEVTIVAEILKQVSELIPQN